MWAIRNINFTSEMIEHWQFHIVKLIFISLEVLTMYKVVFCCPGNINQKTSAAPAIT
jgi:hypothetical protein